MTFSEYADRIGKSLVTAHNNKDKAEAERIFTEADNRLEASKATAGQKKKFWSDVRAAFFSGRFLVEEQANSSLHALMRLIQANLAARGGGK